MDEHRPHLRGRAPRRAKPVLIIKGMALDVPPFKIEVYRGEWAEEEFHFITAHPGRYVIPHVFNAGEWVSFDGRRSPSDEILFFLDCSLTVPLRLGDVPRVPEWRSVLKARAGHRAERHQEHSLI